MEVIDTDGPKPAEEASATAIGMSLFGDFDPSAEPCDFTKRQFALECAIQAGDGNASSIAAAARTFYDFLVDAPATACVSPIRPV